MSAPQRRAFRRMQQVVDQPLGFAHRQLALHDAPCRPTISPMTNGLTTSTST